MPSYASSAFRPQAHAFNCTVCLRQEAAQYEECEVSGMAVRREALADWQQGPYCRPPGRGGIGSVCPLCFKDLGAADDEEVWRAHLIEACAKNPRRA